MAGDALEPGNPDALTATAFWPRGRGTRARSNRDKWIRPTTGWPSISIATILSRTVMTTFVSSTVHCARCHDHKFDPIKQADYYGLQAVFAGIDKAPRRYDADPAVTQKRKAARYTAFGNRASPREEGHDAARAGVAGESL